MNGEANRITALHGETATPGRGAWPSGISGVDRPEDGTSIDECIVLGDRLGSRVPTRHSICEAQHGGRHEPEKSDEGQGHEQRLTPLGASAWALAQHTGVPL